MKTNYFYGSIAIRQCDGYTENLEFNSTESKGLTFRYPYGDSTPEEAYAISTFIRTVNEAYNTLTNQINGVNRDLHLEQYTPTEAAEVSTEVSAVPQTCALGGGEVSTEAGVEIKDAPFEESKTGSINPVDAILATEASSEDGEAVAYFAEELGKIIDARKEKD